MQYVNADVVDVVVVYVFIVNVVALDADYVGVVYVGVGVDVFVGAIICENIIFVALVVVAVVVDSGDGGSNFEIRLSDFINFFDDSTPMAFLSLVLYVN